MPSEMVKRVARIVAAAVGGSTVVEEWEKRQTYGWQGACETAKEILREIRHPTDEMIDAMRDADMTAIGPAPAWWAGIDVALAED